MPVFKDEERNTFYVKTYYTDYTGAKRQKMKRGFKLQRDAKEWERAFLEKQQGTPDMTFKALYELYIEDMSHRLRENSIEGKKNVFKNWILPYFKDRPMNQVTAKRAIDLWLSFRILFNLNKITFFPYFLEKSYSIFHLSSSVYYRNTISLPWT